MKKTLPYLLTPLLLSAFLFSTREGKGQQLPQYSQYQFNLYYLNPAVAGSKENKFASLGYRTQWVGLEGAPTTGLAAFHTDFKDNMGLGGLAFTDKNGPFTRTGVRASYTYHLELDRNMKLGLSLAGLIYQHQLAVSDLNPRDDNDAALAQGDQSSVDPDATFAAYLKGEQYRVGFSSPQLFQTKILGDSLANTKLSRHYYIHGGYQFELTNDIQAAPSMVFKAVSPAPLQVHINAKVIYDEFLWGGISYRHEKAIIPFAGVNYENLFFGYAYDATLSDIRDYSSGSHEVHLGYRFGGGSGSPSFQ